LYYELLIRAEYPKRTHSTSSYMVVCASVLTEHNAMNVYWGSGGIAPLIIWPWH